VSLFFFVCEEQSPSLFHNFTVLFGGPTDRKTKELFLTGKPDGGQHEIAKMRRVLLASCPPLLPIASGLEAHFSNFRSVSGKQRQTVRHRC
jgi:hypothetical protein